MVAASAAEAEGMGEEWEEMKLRSHDQEDVKSYRPKLRTLCFILSNTVVTCEI